MMFNANSLLGALLLLAPTALAQSNTVDLPTVTVTETIPGPGVTVTSLAGRTCTAPDYHCIGCSITEFVTLSTPCRIPTPGFYGSPVRTYTSFSCPTDTFPPLSGSCPGCTTVSCIPTGRPITHWIQTCTYPAGCPEPTKSYMPCPTTPPWGGTGLPGSG
ncbi:hypothetical protein BJ508DRAFT_113479 [Ascobolus immersus RN42]|uniref:Uncharacterized protein n=1 Tax=Ascobolus immersus RN42 TaxID=1160509 RepID=A0A3N4IB10_ASCIM|nr:hypothetical protein BJ508DRAFT_113479 [Ascobolus immersus RN42]